MSDGGLNIEAQSRTELNAKLTALDLAVRGTGSSTIRRERTSMSRLLATLATSGHLQFPLQIRHQDRPDFRIVTAGVRIFVECVEAVPQEWKEIQADRRRRVHASHGGEPKVVFMPRFPPDGRRDGREDRALVLSGAAAEPPWEGDEPERDWVTVMVDTIRRKRAKLLGGSYPVDGAVWLLIQDEWPLPDVDVAAALGLLVPAVQVAFEDGLGFDRVHICTHDELVTVDASSCTQMPIVDLWAPRRT